MEGPSGVSLTGTTPALDLALAAKTVVDLEGRYALTANTSIAIGADNLFDVYPTANPLALNTTGAAQFSNYAPFGRSGRFVYARWNQAF